MKGSKKEGRRKVQASQPSWKKVQLPWDQQVEHGGFLGLEVFDGSLADWASSRANEPVQVAAEVIREDELQDDEGEEDPNEGDAKEVEEQEQEEGRPEREPEAEEVEADVSGNAWEAYLLDKTIQQALLNEGFVQPTKVQEECLPAAIQEARDIVGAAETGSGKTLAFGLPILNKILEDTRLNPMSKKKIKALILTPTRELAIQVHDMIDVIAKPCGIRVVPVVGGMAVQKQQRLLRTSPEIVVGTPGRLWALMEDGEEHLNDFGDLHFLVVDEADRMVEKGHFEELQSILDKIPFAGKPKDSADKIASGEPTRPELQTFVFSATLALPPHLRGGKRRLKQKKNASPILAVLGKIKLRPKAKIVDLTNKKLTAAGLKECFVECTEVQRDDFLYYLLAKHGGQTLIFCNAISSIRRLTSILKILGMPVGSLHANLQQRQRLKVLDRFTKKQISVLVATDVAARGLDIDGVTMVIHYQVPKSVDAYVHRAGRTARASNEGLSIVLAAASQRKEFLHLCRCLGEDALEPFPIDAKVLPAVHERVKLALQIDEVERMEASEKSKVSWFERNAEALGIELDEDELPKKKHEDDARSKMGARKAQLPKLRQALANLLAEPLGRSFDTKFLTRNGEESWKTIETAEKVQQGRATYAKLETEKMSKKKKNKKKRKLSSVGSAFVFGREGADALEVAKQAKTE